MNFSIHKIVTRYFGSFEIYSSPTMDVYCLKVRTGLVKLETFTKSHKLAKSLTYHKEAVANHLPVPDILELVIDNGVYFKFTTWEEGVTVSDALVYSKYKDKVKICKALAEYINILYDFDGLSPVDNHMKNFVWDGNRIIYIDMKKLLKRDYKNHVIQMAKLCLKSLRGDRACAKEFLKAYAKFRDVNPLIDECNRRNWSWGKNRIKPITLEEVVNG